MINVPSVPSPYQNNLNDCDECGMPLGFIEVIDTDEGEMELLRCPCGYTECHLPVVTNDDDLSDLFIVD